MRHDHLSLRCDDAVTPCDDAVTPCDDIVTPCDDVSKVKSTLHQCVRDWSDEVRGGGVVSEWEGEWVSGCGGC